MADINTAGQQINTEPGADNNIPRTFTQEEVSTLCAREAGRAERAILKQFGLTDKAGIADLLSQIQAASGASTALQTATGERDTYKAQLDETRAKLTAYENAAVLAKYGVTDPDDAEFYSFKVGKMVTKEKDFSKAAEEYFKDHPVNAGRIQLAPENKGNSGINFLNDMINKRLRGEI